MEQTHSTTAQAPRVAAATDTHTAWNLAKLLFSLLLGALMVWVLRQESAKSQPLLWIPFVLAMFGAASALRQMDLWLPGQPILPRLAQVPPRSRDIFGAICIAVAQGLSWLIVQRLLPDYQKLWHGLPALWFGSILLVLFGASILGTVGRGSPRAATASTLWSDSPHNRRLEIMAFILIFALAIFLRTYRIDSLPSGIYVDETNGAIDSLYILEGRSASPFANGWYGTPNGYLYYMAGIFKVLGANWIALKIASLIPAILTVAAIYFLGRLIFGPSAGLMAMLFMAVSRWHLSMSRWGWNETAPPLFQILATFFLIRGLRDRRASDYALSGILLSLSLYTYLSARLVVATLLLYILYWILSDPSGVRASLRRSWLGFVVFTVAALVAIAPAGVTYFKDPSVTNNRVSEISILNDIREQGSLRPLAQNIGDILKFFHQTGDHQGKHNLPDEPMTDPITGLFFAVGLAYAIYRWRDQRYFLLIIWLVIGLAGSFLSSYDESPQSYRALTALPAVILLAADTLDRVTRALYRSLQERFVAETPPRWPANPGYLATGFAILMLTGATLWEATVYFGRQANSSDVERGFNPTENSVAREVIAALESDQEIYLSPRFSTYSPLRFLVYGVVKSQTGASTLDDPPYHVVLPEVNFPLPDTGHDVLILLDSNYWPLRDFLTSIYPEAKIELQTLSDDSPIYIRMEIPHEQISSVQGLTETITYADRRTEERPVSQVDIDLDTQQASEIRWTGAIRIEHGGEYELKGEGGLEIFIDGLPVSGKKYFGRGLYNLVAVWNAGDRGNVQLLWRTSGTELTPVPTKSLFRLPERQHGLLATYWNNTNWENAPTFHQFTPFLMLAWPDEQPIVPNGPFTARYTGLLNITDPDTYTFRIEADDGARLVMDDIVLGEGMAAGQPNTFEVRIALSAGIHPIRIDYFQQGGGSALRVFWRKGDASFTPIPPSALIPAQP